MQNALDRLAVVTVTVLPVLPDVGDVQEGGALEADFDERRLHARQHACDFPQIDVADQTARARAFHVQLLHDRLLEHRDSRLLRRDVDENFVGHWNGNGSLIAAYGRW